MQNEENSSAYKVIFVLSIICVLRSYYTAARHSHRNNTI